VAEPENMEASAKAEDASNSHDAPPAPIDAPPESEPSPDKKYLLTLISRRSVYRAGLRYLRRGVDGEGYVANSVETEQVLSPTSWAPERDEKLYSFVQYRGSIPVFFSQSPYSK
jgi:hypothetical protein